jgi:hypothetical protein
MKRDGVQAQKPIYRRVCTSGQFMSTTYSRDGRTVQSTMNFFPSRVS